MWACRSYVLLTAFVAFFATSLRAQQPTELDKLKQGLQKATENERVDAIQKWKGSDADAVKAAELLVKALGDKSNAVQQAAATALVKLGDKAAMPVGAVLSGATVPVRKQCLRILEQLGPKGKSAAPAVAKLLADGAGGLKMEAQRTLAAMGPKAIPAIIDLYKSNEKLASDTLKQMGAATIKDALPQLIAMMKDKNPALRRGAAGILANIGPEARPALPQLAALMRDPDQEVRNQAGAALYGFRQEAVAPLVEEMKIVEARKHWAEMTNLIVRITQQIPPGLATVLGKHLENKDPQVRASALQVVQPHIHRARDMAGALVPLLGDPDPSVRALAANSMNNLYAELVPALVKQFKNPSEEVRLAVLVYLKQRFQWRSRDIVADLAPLVADKDARVRKATADLLVVAASPEAMWPLATMLADEQKETRQVAADALQRLTYVRFSPESAWKDKAVAAMIKALGDMELRVRNVAQFSLQKAGADPSISLALLQSKEAPLRIIGANAIAAWGKADKDAIPILIAGIKNGGDVPMQNASVYAVARLGQAAIPALSEAAVGGDKSVMKAIARLGRPGLNLLVDLTAHKDVPVRLATIEALGEVRVLPRQIHADLRKIAEDDKQPKQVRDAAMRVLILAENPEIRDLDALLRGLQDKDRDIRRTAVQKLARLRGTVVPTLIEIAMKSPSTTARTEAIRTLGIMGTAASQAVTQLIDVLRSDKADDLPLRIHVLAALDKMHPEADPGLLGILIDADPSLQTAVLEMLRPEQAKLAKDLVIEMLRSKNPDIRAAAARALSKAGAGIARDLAPLLEDKDGDIRAAALLAIESFETTEVLGKYLSDDKLPVREVAGRALAKRGVKSHGVLAEALHSKDYRAQVAAANALALMENRPADSDTGDRIDVLLPDLIGIMLAKGARDLELQAAARAIQRINPVLGARQMAQKAAVADLLGLLKKPAMEVRELTCLALVEKGPAAADAVPALAALLKEPATEAGVLAAAARALHAVSPPPKQGDDDRLPPDLLERIVKGTHEKSTLLREEIMDSLQKQFLSQGENSAEVLLAAFHLGGPVVEANNWLAHRLDAADLTDVDGPNYVRILALYHAGSKIGPVRLTPNTEQALKEQFWRYLKTHSSLLLPPRQADIEASEVKGPLPIELLVGRITAYLAIDVLKDDPLYKDRKLQDRTLADIHRTWTQWWREWARERALGGLWSEMGWPAHQLVIWPCLLNMSDCASDAVVRQRFKMLLDLTAVEEEQISVGGVRAGRRGRGNGAGCALDPFKDVLFGQLPRRPGEAGVGYGGIVWTSSYQLPAAAILLRKLDRPQPYYSINNHCYGGSVSAQATPHYVLGCQRLTLQMIGTMEAYGNWHRLVFDDMKAIIFPLTTGERRHFLHGNVCISTWAATKTVPQSIRFSSDFVRVEKEGWIFLSNGPAFAAIFIEGGYDLEKPAPAAGRKIADHPSFDTLAFKDPRAMVVLHAGDVHKFASFEKFQDAILKAPLKVSKATVHYAGPQAPAIDFFRAKASLVNGAPVADAKIYDSPYLQAQMGQPQVTVRFGSWAAVYDFDNNVIREEKK